MKIVSKLVTVSMFVACAMTSSAFASGPGDVGSVDTKAVSECLDNNGQDILNQPEVFLDLISKKATCYEAAKLANACAYGSSLDIQTADRAVIVCQAELAKNHPSKSDLALLAKMQKRCEAHLKHQGTMYMAMYAFCRLSAQEWMNSLNYKNEAF